MTIGDDVLLQNDCKSEMGRLMRVINERERGVGVVRASDHLTFDANDGGQAAFDITFVIGCREAPAHGFANCVNAVEQYAGDKTGSGIAIWLGRSNDLRSYGCCTRTRGGR